MLPEEGDKADAEFDPGDLSLYTNTEFFEFDIGEGDGEQEGSERFTIPEETQLKNGHLGFLNGVFYFFYYSPCYITTLAARRILPSDKGGSRVSVLFGGRVR
jgi:hypothetical protein